MKSFIQFFFSNTFQRLGHQSTWKPTTGELGSLLRVRKNLSLLHYDGYRMKVPEKDQLLLNKEETHKDRVVKAFFTQFDDHIKVYSHQRKVELQNSELNYPRNSWYKVVLPLSSNPELRFKFQRFYSDAVRIGRLLELMDYIASSVAYKYVKVNEDIKVSIVTAIVDNIQFFNKIVSDQDLSIQGYVNYVGRSSIEVQIDLLQKDASGQEENLCVSAVFLMVARNPTDHKQGYQAPQLSMDGEDKGASLRYEIGKKNQEQRKQFSQSSLLKKSPQQAEIEHLHEYFMNRNVYVDDPNYIQINDTQMEKNMLMHIQDKNLHGKIFGGHVMREAFELGWLNAYLHVKGVCFPEIYHIDDVQFIAPVDIGTTLSIRSKVTFIKDQILHCQVDCSKILPDNTKIKTNDLHLTFELSKWEGVRQVFPRTYSEGMLWLDAKRKIDSNL